MEFSFPLEDLMIGVQRIFVLLDEHSLVDPAFQKIGRAAVLLVRPGVPGFVPVQFEANDVAGMLLVQLFLEFAVDHVVRRDSVTSDRSPTWAMSYLQPKG